MPNSIQPRDRKITSKGGDVGGVLYKTDSNGYPNLLGLNRNGNGRKLNAHYDNPGNRWNRKNGFAFLVQLISSFLSHLLREFCFVSCPDQPPRFLPTSSNFNERAMYFLLSNDFVSQSNIKNTLSVSNFLIAKRT